MVIVNKHKKVLVSNCTIREVKDIEAKHRECKVKTDRLWDEFNKLLKQREGGIHTDPDYTVYTLDVWKQVMTVGGKISSYVMELYEDSAMGKIDWPFNGDDDVDYYGTYIDAYLDGSMMVHSTERYEIKNGQVIPYILEEGDEWIDLPYEFTINDWLSDIDEQIAQVDQDIEDTLTDWLEEVTDMETFNEIMIQLKTERDRLFSIKEMQ